MTPRWASAASPSPGGQRQRLAIARAVVANPRVLILDDATSSVDASTEQRIKLALAEAMAGRTTFVIAHRLSTIEVADQIVVLEHGRIVAQATTTSCSSNQSFYRRSSRHLNPPRAPTPSSPRGYLRRTPVASPTPGVGYERSRIGRMGAGGGRGGGRAPWPGGGRGGPAQWAGERPSPGSRGRNLRGLLELLRPTACARPRCSLR